MLYRYKALDGTGAVSEGTVQALSEAEAVGILKEKSLNPIQIAQDAGKAQKKLSRRRIGRKEIMQMTSQLASLLKAKMPLAQALESVESQSANYNLQKLTAEIKNKIQSGSALSETLAEYPNYFSNLYVSMVRSGEEAGLLAETLGRVSQMLEKDEALRKRIKGAMTYPAIMFAVMILSVSVLMTFVVPKFTSVFSDMGGALPLPTKLLIGTSDIFKNYWWLILGLAAAGFFGFKAYVKTGGGRRAVDAVMLRLPLFGRLLKDMIYARFSLTLGVLLSSGVPLLDGLRAVKAVAGNSEAEHAVDGVIEDVRSGSTLRDAISARGDMFDTLIVNMIGTGEQSGELADMLMNIGSYYEQEADSKVKAMTTLLEPVIILLMGLIVGVIIVAMLMPIFEMGGMVN